MRGSKARAIRKQVCGNGDFRDRQYDAVLHKVMEIEVPNPLNPQGTDTVLSHRFQMISDTRRRTCQALKKLSKELSRTGRQGVS